MRSPSRTAQIFAVRGSSVQSQRLCVDIDRPHLDAVLARVADDLRRRIEAHRLRIEQRGAEDIRDDGISSSDEA